MMSDFDFQQMYNDMPFRKRASVFLHQNHFLFWKITLIDVTIVVPLFFLIAYTLDRCTSLDIGYAVLIAAAVCSMIEYFRIRFRRVKTYQHLSDQVNAVRRLLAQYSEAVERSGTEEERERLSDTMAKIESFNQTVEHMAGIAYQEDVLGLTDDE